MHRILLVILAGMLSFPSVRRAQDETLTASTLPEFLARYEQNLGPLDQAYEELTNENVPLRDETGQPLGRRHIEDRRQALAGLRQTVHQLASSPSDLVLTTTLFAQTEALVDDLFDLSQICYDNDREELGKLFSDLETTIDRNNDLVESYALKLATAKQDRLQELEKENRDLQQKLKEAAEREKTKVTAP